MGRTIQRGSVLQKHSALSLLCDLGETYGRKLVEQSNGELVRASIYVLPSQLERGRFVASHYIDTPTGEKWPRRRLYRVTGIGARALRAWEATTLAWRAITP